MFKKIKNYLFLLPLLIVGSLMYAPQAHAESAYDQTSTDGTYTTSEVVSYGNFGTGVSISEVSIGVTPTNPDCTINTIVEDALNYSGTYTYEASNAGTYANGLWTFTFSSPVDLSSLSLWLALYSYTCSSGGWTGYTFTGHSAPAGYWSGEGSDAVPYIYLNGQPPTVTNSFSAPTAVDDDADVPYYQPITFSGTCVNNGSNELALTFGHSDGSIDNVTAPGGIPQFNGSYNIDCDSNTWTTTISGVPPDDVAAILMTTPGTTTIASDVILNLYVTQSGGTLNYLSFDPVMTHSPETNDFNDWLLDLSGDPNVDSTSTDVCVDYGLQTSTDTPYQDCSYIINPSLFPNYPGTVEIPKINLSPLPEGNYKAVGYWTDLNSEETLATTTEWDFSIVFSTSTKPSTDFPNGASPASTANSGNGNNSLNPNCNQGNIIVTGICNVAVYLFMPKSSDLTQFDGLFAQIKNKPPFGYFVAAETAISDLATSTPVATLAGITLLSGFFSPLRTGFTMLIYLLAGFFIFNRLRHFNFQS